MDWTGERVTPWTKSMRLRPDVVQDHIARYNWALPWVNGRTVVDLGCGTGYGSFLMSFLAETVIGLDVDRESIEFAQKHFAGVEFLVCDLESGSELPGADVYVAFELLEHLRHPQVLSIRVHDCPHCGLKLDRDHNAALNILARGLSRLQAGSSVTDRSRANSSAAE